MYIFRDKLAALGYLLSFFQPYHHLIFTLRSLPHTSLSACQDIPILYQSEVNAYQLSYCHRHAKLYFLCQNILLVKTECENITCIIFVIAYWSDVWASDMVDQGLIHRLSKLILQTRKGDMQDNLVNKTCLYQRNSMLSPNCGFLQYHFIFTLASYISALDVVL